MLNVEYKEVYINLVDQREPKLNLKNSEISENQYGKIFSGKENKKRKIIRPSLEELELHKKYLKTHLQKNNYN